jgi:carbon starvation protein
MIATALLVFSWGYFIYTGNINTIWPMFGVANQLLGAVALAVATTILINMGKVRYSWVTLLPLSFLATNTLWGGFLNVRDNFWPLAVGPNADAHVQGYVLSVCTVLMMVCAVVILASAVAKWVSVLSSDSEPVPAEG